MTRKTLDELNDDADIIAIVTALVTAADANAWRDAADLFAPEVALSVGGPEPVRVGPDALVARWSHVLGGCDATVHTVGTHRVRVTGDEATCDATVIGFHLVRDGERTYVTYGRFRFALVRAATAHRWAIGALGFELVHGLGDASVLRE